MNQYIKIDDPHYERYGKWDFNNMKWYSRPYEYRWVVDTVFELSDNTLVLDAACGVKHPGYVMLADLDNVKRVVAVDPLPQLMKNRIDHKKVVKVLSTMEDFEYTEPFDIITCISSMEHMNQWEVVVDKFWDLLKPGGYCILTIDISIHGNPNPHLANWKLTPLDYKEHFEKIGFELVGDYDDTQYPEIITGAHTKFGPSKHHELSAFKFLLRKPNE